MYSALLQNFARMKIMKKINFLTILVVLSSIVVISLVLTLPEIVPVHLNLKGEVDRYGSKWLVLLGPVIALIATMAIQIYLRKVKNKSPEALQITMSVILAFIIGICWLPYIITTHTGLTNIGLILGVLFGGLLIFAGNYMGLLKTNRVVGVRVKWTLADEEIWQKTHRFCGYTMVIVGVLIWVVALIEVLFHSDFLIISIIVFPIISALITVVYSYIIYRKKHKLSLDQGIC